MLNSIEDIKYQLRSHQRVKDQESVNGSYNRRHSTGEIDKLTCLREVEQTVNSIDYWTGTEIARLYKGSSHCLKADINMKEKTNNGEEEEIIDQSHIKESENAIERLFSSINDADAESQDSEFDHQTMDVRTVMTML